MSMDLDKVGETCGTVTLIALTILLCSLMLAGSATSLKYAFGG